MRHVTAILLLWVIDTLGLNDMGSDARQIFAQANKLYAAGNLELAVSKYRESLANDPRNSDTYTNLGSALLDLEMTEDAIEAYELALNVDPENADAAFNLGLVYHDAGNEGKAIELYKQTLRSSQERIDAWMNLASCFHAIGDIDKSIFAYNKVLEKMAANQEEHEDTEVKSKVYEYLGRALLRKRDTLKANGQIGGGDDEAYNRMTNEANGHLQSAVEIDPTNNIAKHMLASNSAQVEVESAPMEYVRKLFDDYSDNFESSLANLEYRVPSYIAEQVTRLEKNWRVIIDLGCGTGLLGPLLLSLPATGTEAPQEIAQVVVGVDLSPKMLDIAAKKSTYDVLAAADIVEFMEMLLSYPESATSDFADIKWITSKPSPPLDTIALLQTQIKETSVLYAAADVLVYIGDLRKLFSVISRSMKCQDAFVFTVENADMSTDKSESSKEAGWILQNTGRYAHHMEYIEQLAAETGMEIAVVRNIHPRKELNSNVEGYLCILYRIC